MKSGHVECGCAFAVAWYLSKKRIFRMGIVQRDMGVLMEWGRW